MCTIPRQSVESQHANKRAQVCEQWTVGRRTSCLQRIFVFSSTQHSQHSYAQTVPTVHQQQELSAVAMMPFKNMRQEEDDGRRRSYQYTGTRMCISHEPVVDQAALVEYQKCIETALLCPICSDVINFSGNVEGWEGLTSDQICQLSLQLNACNTVRKVTISRTKFSEHNFIAFIQALRNQSQLKRFVLNGEVLV